MSSLCHTSSFPEPQSLSSSFGGLSSDDHSANYLCPLESNDNGNYERDVITPQAFMHHVHPMAHPSRPLMIPDDLILTNKRTIGRKLGKKDGETVHQLASPTEILMPKPRFDCDIAPVRSSNHPLYTLNISNNLSSSTRSLPSPPSSPGVSPLYDSACDTTYFSPKEMANLILQPKDESADIFVESSVISVASPVLAKSIEAIVDTGGNKHTANKGSLPVFKIEEDPETLTGMVQFCYPRRTPKIRSLEQLERLLAACQTYRISNGIQQLRVTILEFSRLGAAGKMVVSPFECYGLACRLGYHDVAKLTSTHCIMVDVTKVDLGYTLAGVAQRDIKRLLSFRILRASKAMAILNDGVDARELWCDKCSGSAKWYLIFVDAAEKELKRAPASYVIFSTSFIAGCLARASKDCPGCVIHYLGAKAQLRLAVLQRDIDALKDTI